MIMWFRTRPLAAFISALAAALAVPGASGSRDIGDRRGGLGSGKSLHLRDEEDGLARPSRFDQRLLVCNAYPSASPLEVRQNGKVLADGHSAIKFNECRYLTTRVKSRDKLDLLVQGQELHGTFEVGELPATDAVLLLVPERHHGSAIMNFQSFAFPTNLNNKDAQLAVINTIKGNETAPHLQVEDHITGKEEQTVSKRIEQLNFDRVYSVEEGAYDVSFAYRPTEGPPRRGEQKLLTLRKSQNIVVLRTGDDKGQFPESLVVFPETALLHSAGRRTARAASMPLAVAAALAFGIR